MMGLARVREYLDNLATIDVHKLKNRGLLASGTAFQMSWHRGHHGVATITCEVVDTTLWITIRGLDQTLGRRSEVFIDLEMTRCHFGGSRTWFRCPRCDTRRGKLYFASERVVCRHCVGAAYRCQSETQAARAIRLARRVRRRLGASTNLTVPITDKPKGMHWRTFGVLTEQCRAAEAVAVADIARRMNSLPGIR
jgi:hypothetical protein